MDNFKRCHIIKTDITLQSKVENDHLFVFYNDQWIQLSKNKIPLKRDASGPEGYSDTSGLDWNLCIV